MCVTTAAALRGETPQRRNRCRITSKLNIYIYIYLVNMWFGAQNGVNGPELVPRPRIIPELSAPVHEYHGHPRMASTLAMLSKVVLHCPSVGDGTRKYLS